MTPTTTRIVALKNRAKAATLFARDVRQLQQELFLTVCATALRDALVDANSREPYRDYLEGIITKLDLTLAWCQQELDSIQATESSNGTAEEGGSATSSSSLGPHHEAVSRDDIYTIRQEFTDDLMLVYESLQETGHGFIADGLLTDILRNVSAFRLTLIPLDVRQESDRHEEAMDCITRNLGLGSFKQWDEQTRIEWLTTQISSKERLLRPGVWKDHPENFPPTAVDTLEIFAMIADQLPESLGTYVISQATSASDVLSVLLLQLDAGVQKPLGVAPLFETLGDLQGAEDTMRSLYSLPAYMGVIHGKQQITIGYSDSAKDAGRLAASWAQYETQEKLSALAKEYGVDVTFFHGKGGTVGRGGNPQTFLAIMAHAPETINGYFRVTEQGEMINQNFGFGDRAERTLDIYTAAVLAEKLTERPSPSKEYRDMMQ